MLKGDGFIVLPGTIGVIVVKLVAFAILVSDAC
jgi:hypothetical protein